MFDTGSGLALLFDANCGVRTQVYSLNISYTGTANGRPTVLTSDCTTSNGISNWDAAKGSTEYMLVYSCQTASNAYNIKSVPITLAGSAGTSVALESVTSNYQMRAAWNGTASAYGMVEPGAFRRLSTAGAVIGGSIATASEDPWSIGVTNGTWVVGSGDRTYYNYCSKINSSGTLQCNRVSISYADVFLDSSTILSAYQGSGSLKVRSFDVSNCTSADGNTISGITNNVSLLGIRDSISLSSTLAASVWTTSTSKSLIVGVFSKTTADNIYTEAAVANYTTSITDAHMQIIQNKIYVAYAIDGALKVNYSTQNVP